MPNFLMASLYSYRNLHMGVDTAKRKMRSQVRAKVKGLEPAEMGRQSHEVCSQVLASPEYQRAESVALFLSTGREVDTGEVLHDIFRTGKRCFVPRIRDNNVTTSAAGLAGAGGDAWAEAVTQLHGVMDMLEIQSLDELSEMQPNRYGILEPGLARRDGKPRAEGLDCAELAMVLVPGMAFDGELRRLGYGKGYYDRWMSKLKESRQARQLPKVACWGLCFREQLVAGPIPTGPHDLMVDRIITASNQALRSNSSSKPP
eukprot:gb/GEZN01008686.1/.p1 GENE.gb/GEZN01008686.1/~~gb/GEZN01008686.1/.p1  ORF type:complete len:259 (-),score=37.58 gb/GEZN01008686.1/:519-1295(-)